MEENFGSNKQKISLEIFSDKKYGILLSGGLDSAILLHLILKANRNIDLQCFTIPKRDGAILYANPVIDYFNKQFKINLPKTIKVGDPTAHHRQQSVTAVKDIFQKYPVDFLFIAINKNPPELDDLDGAPKRATKSDDPKIIFPFVDLLKTDILEILYDEDIEDLIELTHTCTEQTKGRCNRCWQCTERSWAFSKLGKIDTGTR